MSRTYTLTYDCVTPESAADGEYSDTGFGDGASPNSTSTDGLDYGDPDGRAAWEAARAAATGEITAEEDEKDERMDLDDAAAESAVCIGKIVALIRRHYGATEPSSSPWSVGTWYTATDGSTDYATGEVTRVSVHLDGWTEAEERAIYAAVTGR